MTGETPPQLAALRPVRDDDAEALQVLIRTCWDAYPGCILDIDGEEPWLRAPATASAAKGGQVWVVPAPDGAANPLAASVALYPAHGSATPTAPEPTTAAALATATASAPATAAATPTAPATATAPAPATAAGSPTAPEPATAAPTTSATAIAELKTLYVWPDARRSGLGAALVAHVEREAQARFGATRMELWSDTRFTDAHRLYERLGYRRGSTRALHDLSNTLEYFYARDLGGPGAAEPPPM